MSKVLADLYYNLSVMLDAGIPILRAIDIAEQSCKSPMIRVIGEIHDMVSAGNTLSDAMENFPRCFSRFEVTAVKAADRSGSLPEVLRLLSDWHQFMTSIKRQIMSGLMLPLAVLVVAAFIVPLPFVILSNDPLWTAPLQSLYILATFAAPILIIYAILKLVPKDGPIRQIFDLISLKIPLLGKALKHFAVSRFCFTFYVLQKAALPVTESMELALKSTTNAVVAECLKGGLVSAAEGRQISEGLKSPFVDGFVELWSIGEETGQTDSVAKKLAEQNREESLHYFTLFGYWIPKVIYAVICLWILIQIFRMLPLLSSAYSV